jgi:anaerobic selenocysteine-containing dehydrogenase
MADSARSTWRRPGLFTIGGSFWEFGEPDWENTKYFMMFGVAEDHDQPDQDRPRQAQGRGAKFVSVNPVRTGYSAIADEWIGIRPGHRRPVHPGADP